MTAPLIYLSGDQRPESCEALDGVVRADDLQLTNCSRVPLGPDGKRGTLWYFHDPAKPQSWPHLVINEDRQTWEQIGDSGVWIGTTNDKPVTPDDLLRSGGIRAGGYFVGLSDGNQWAVPNTTDLPLNFAVGAGNHLTETVRREFRDANERAVWAFQTASEFIEQDQQITPATGQRIIEYCGLLLSLNYRVNWQVATTLGLFDAHTAWQTLLMSLDQNALSRLVDYRTSRMQGV